MSYSIGTSSMTFLRREGQRGKAPELLTQIKSVFQRPGIDGTSIRLDGSKGLPFQMSSIVDTQTFDEALVEFDNYKQYEIDGVPVELVWESVNYSAAFGVKYVVLMVHDPTIRRVRNVVGPAKISTSPGYLLECMWDLLPVEDQQE